MLAILLAALLAQDKAAEDVLKRIEDTIAAADTVKAEFKIDGIPYTRDSSITADGTIEIKKGGKSRFVQTLYVEGQKVTGETVCDGKRKYSRSGDSASVPYEAPKTTESQARACLTFLSMTFASSVAGSPQRDKDVRDYFKIESVKTGDDDGPLKTIVVTFKPGRPDGPVPQSRIWYDPKTFLISKRTLTGGKGGIPGTITESFSKITLGAPIDDDVFHVPDDQ